MKAMRLLTGWTTLLNYWHSSIQRRLILSFGASTFLLLMLAGYLLYQQQRTVYYQENSKHASSLAHALAKSSTSWVLAHDLAGLQEVMSGLQDTQDLKHAWVLSINGEILASSRQAEVGLFVRDAISQTLLRSRGQEMQVLVDQAQMIDLAVPIMAGKQRQGWVRIALSRQTANHDLQQILYFLMWFALLSAVVVAMIAAGLAQGLAVRFTQFIHVADQIKAGNHAIRICTPYQDELGQMVGDVNEMLDVLCESELRFRQLADNIHEVFWMTSPDKNQMLYVSSAYKKIWGKPLSSLMENPHEWLESIHPEDRPMVAQALGKQVRGEYNLEYRIVRPDGKLRWIHDRAFPVCNAQGVVYRVVGVAEDITQQKLAMYQLQSSEERLDFLAHHDPLTGLPNRLLINMRLGRAIERAIEPRRKLAFLMIDLDRFKNVNDSFGHAMGDELLQLVSKRLSSMIRAENAVSRFGGDEFTVLLEDVAEVEVVADLANQLIGVLSEPYWLSIGVQVSIGASVGISLFPEHGQSEIVLLQNADAALYEAKANGRGRYRFYREEMSRTVRERIEMETRLREAIDQGRLRVYYQPQIDLRSGKVVGAEALVRWQKAEGSFVPPADFIPVAEESGLIAQIGEWVLREACLQAQRWLLAGYPPLVLAVNLSPRQTQHCDVVAKVSEILQDTSFPARYLELELTESALMRHEDDVLTMLHQLRALGIRLAIDDFGTGYSSLSYLKHFPLDVLKIDKSFVDDIVQSQQERELVSTIINMGHILGFAVLAEGVETEAQRDFLARHHCDYYQGFLTSPALTAERFEQRFLNVNHPPSGVV